MLSDSDLTDEAYLLFDLGGDDLDFIELIMAIELEFDIYISDEEMETILTVGDLIEVVNEKMEASGGIYYPPFPGGGDPTGGGDDGSSGGFPLSAGGYFLEDFDHSLSGGKQISASVQAPFGTELLHKATVVDGISLNKPLSKLIFSFKYDRNNPTGITGFEFDAESIGITYELSQTAIVTNIINTSNQKTITFNFTIKQSFAWKGSPISFIYKCHVDYYPLSETAYLSYSKI